MMALSAPELLALVTGEVVVAFAARGTCTEGDEVELGLGAELSATQLKPAYRRWLGAEAPSGRWRAVVVAVDPSRLLGADAGGSRHLRMAAPTDGDVLLLRVEGPDGPVLSDEAFAARRRSVEGAMR
jgi:hypothetical protein